MSFLTTDKLDRERFLNAISPLPVLEQATIIKALSMMAASEEPGGDNFISSDEIVRWCMENGRELARLTVHESNPTR